jgi:hypothetical protein
VSAHVNAVNISATSKQAMSASLAPSVALRENGMCMGIPVERVKMCAGAAGCHARSDPVNGTHAENV